MKAILDPGQCQEGTKPGIPSGTSPCLVTVWNSHPSASPCPAPLTEGERELSSWMPTVPLDVIPNPYFAFFSYFFVFFCGFLVLFKTLGWRKNPKQSSDTRVGSAVKEQGKGTGRAHSQMLGFLLTQPLSRGTNGNRQPNRAGQRQPRWHRSSDNSPALPAGGADHPQP